MQAKITELANQLSEVKKSVADLQTIANTNKDEIATLKADIATLNTKVVALTSATSATTPATGVLVSIVGNVFTGNSLLNYNAFTAAGTQSQSVTYKIDNRTGKTLNSIQLALGLENVDASGIPVNFPSVTSISLASSNLSFVWSSQSTGLDYLKGWISNPANTGFLNQIVSFSQGAGAVNYTLTVSVTSTGAAAAMNILPIFQVLSYTTQ
jgi:hypothetical protein